MLQRYVKITSWLWRIGAKVGNGKKGVGQQKKKASWKQNNKKNNKTSLLKDIHEWKFHKERLGKLLLRPVLGFLGELHCHLLVFLLLGLLINGDCQYSLLRWLCLQEINQIQVNIYLFNNHHYGLGNMRESLGWPRPRTSKPPAAAIPKA